MQLLVGTYSFAVGGMEGNGEGIYSVSFDTETGAFGAPRLLAECVNPSSLTLSPDGQTLFAGREVFAGDKPGISSFRLEASGALSELSHLPVTGELPCHLAFDPVHGRLACAQYWTGDVAVCSVAEGSLQAVSYLSRTGTGPNTARQEGPHAHFVAFSDAGEVLHLVDLGTDSIVSHRLSDDNFAVETTNLSVPAGCGPRHMVLSRDGNLAWVLCELDESLITLVRAGIGWRIDTVQPGFAAPRGEDGSGASIRLSPDERHIYVSGRRQSRIAGFDLDGNPIGETDCGGLCPREFVISSDGHWLIAANQASNTLTSLRRDANTGKLALTGYSCPVGSPVALIFAT